MRKVNIIFLIFVLAKNNIDVINGFGKFVDSHTIEVTLADCTKEQVTADHILIATGGLPYHPNIKNKNTVLIQIGSSH